MSKRDRRAVILGLAIVIAAWASLRGVPGAARWLAHQEEEVAQRAELLVRAQLRVGELGALADSIESYSRIAEALPKLLLVGEDGATASIDLMDRLRALLATPSVRTIGFTSRRGGSGPGPLSLASVAVRIETDFQGLVETLNGIELDSALGVEAVKVTARHPDGAQGMERLQAEISVGAFFRLPEDAGETPRTGASGG